MSRNDASSTHNCSCCGASSSASRANVVQAQSVDEALKDLVIDGYKVTFSQRVTLLPVDLVAPQLHTEES